MQDFSDKTIYLADYTPPAFLVDTVNLTFRLDPHATRVLSRISFRPNPESKSKVFFLHGEGLTFIKAKIDGVKDAKVTFVDGGLTCDVPDAPFLWEAEVEIDPANNTALEGLYMSNGMYCTQCEAEGFRKITYYPDRPDVLAVFSVTIESDLPVKLSNGNLMNDDPGAGRAEWHDPWPKPSYLFALVAGDLIAHSDHFTTFSGKDVALNIYVRLGDEGKCAFGMEALKRSMRWDEDTYGREYDLDVFNIVAVDDFNMGAMENKGLNIFNSSCVLASPETSTDTNFERIEAIIAHEYFHNWTGNRITCRDWFQLCLKEGLTVFRDQQFTGDLRGHAVKRINDANDIRTDQFREDEGPLSHPVRPEKFVEINNFYTATVYEKGAEVIGMLKRLVGDAAYAEAVTEYFDRHDGQAATIENWLKVFEDVTGRDLTQFKRWYSQSGTPKLTVKEDWADGTFTLHFKQQTAPTRSDPHKEPQVIPIAVGLLNPNGDEVVPTTCLEMTKAEQSFVFTGLASRPVASILREFSAPVLLDHSQTDATRAFLLAHDTDPFNKWDAGQVFARNLLIRMIVDDAAPDPAYLDALDGAIADGTLDPAFRALLLQLPTEEDLAQTLHERGTVPDPAKIDAALNLLRDLIAQNSRDTLGNIYATHQVPAPYSPDPDAAGKRSLANAALRYLTRHDAGGRARAQFKAADNMTQQQNALSSLLAVGMGSDELIAFETKWHADRLVMDKWFNLQVALAPAETAAATADRLTRHPAFDLKNPNRFRSVFWGLASNHAGFHYSSGQGYALLADWLIKLDPINPQTTARLTKAFQSWRLYDESRQRLARDALSRIGASPTLSRDTGEIVDQLLSG